MGHFIWTGEGQLRSCVATLDTCQVTYQIDSLKLGMEHEWNSEQLFIYVDMNSTGYHKIRDGKAIEM